MLKPMHSLAGLRYSTGTGTRGVINQISKSIESDFIIYSDVIMGDVH